MSLPSKDGETAEVDASEGNPLTASPVVSDFSNISSEESEPFSDDSNMADPERPTIIESDHEILPNADTHNDRYRMLGISTCHAGTFTFSKQVQEKDVKVTMLPSPVLKENARNFHLSDFGQGVSFVGTKACCTCVGVYFKICRQRFFCAHINAWPRARDGTYDAHVRPRTPEWDDLKKAIHTRLLAHSYIHGWRSWEVKKETLLLVWPWPKFAGNAVVAGIQEFLQLPDSLPIDEEHHGFIIAPGALDGKTNIKMLTCEDFNERQIHNDIPVQFEEVLYKMTPGNRLSHGFAYTKGASPSSWQ